MKKPTFPPSLVLLLLGALLLAGCSEGDSKPPMGAANSAPAPANLTPEQKRDYEEAIKRTQPPSPSMPPAR